MNPRRKEVYIDELETGDNYLVQAVDLNKDPLIEEIETGEVLETGYNPIGKKDTVLGWKGSSGTAYRIAA